MNNFKILYIIIVILLGIIFLMKLFPSKCENKTKVINKIKIDTVYKVITNTITSKPILIREIPLKDTLYLLDSNGYMYKEKLDKLIKDHTTNRIYYDSLVLDSFGYIVSIDSLRYNKLLNKKYRYHLNIPTINKTELIQPKSKVKFYLGGGMMVNKELQIININSDFLIQTKKDALFGPSIILNSDVKLGYGFKIYWKL